MNPKIILALRILMGLMVLVFGLNKFVNFMPALEVPGDGGILMGIYFTSGFLKIIGVLEILGGLALLIGKYVPLALTILLAILFNAFVFHALHNPENILPAIVGLVLGLVLVYAHKERFSSLLGA